MLASMEPEDEHYADAVTTAVIATKLFKKLRDRWEKDKGTQTVTIDITEAMVLWRIDGLGLDNYSGNVFRKIIEQTHLTLCNQPTLTALPATGLMVK
jgi:Holliday junction resolvasome RuvABC ATP-dependent DNA helicase subunit